MDILTRRGKESIMEVPRRNEWGRFVFHATDNTSVSCGQSALYERVRPHPSRQRWQLIKGALIMFSLSEVPETLECPRCGYSLRELRLSDRFEFYTARVLQAKVAQPWNAGFDVYDSELVPDVTFQIKVANAREGRHITKIVNDRLSTWSGSPHWTWYEKIAGGADV